LRSTLLARAADAVGGRVGQQLVEVSTSTGGERKTEFGDVTVRRDLGLIDPQHRFSSDAGLASRERAVLGLPVHPGQARIGEVSAIEPVPARPPLVDGESVTVEVVA
jgi:hypothetical protein